MADDNLAVTFQGSAPDADFDAIHDAFMDTERGRWFLVEFSRRNRHADTTLLLAAIGRIESILLAQRAAESPPRPQQDPAALANPSAIRPDDDTESKVQIARAIGESAGRLRAAVKPLRDVAWSMREQGDMRCEVLERQAVEIAQACTAFDTLRRELGAADANEIAAAVEPAPTPHAETVAVAEAPQPQPEQPAHEETTEPSPAQTFTRGQLLDTLPPAREPAPLRATPADIAQPEAKIEDAADASADDLFEDLLFEEIAQPEPIATSSGDAAAPAISEASPHAIEHAPTIEQDLAIEQDAVADQDLPTEGPFDSSQAKRLTRLINLFAGDRVPETAEQMPHEAAAKPAAAFVSEGATVESVAAPAPVTERATAEPSVVFPGSAEIEMAAAVALPVEPAQAESVAAPPVEDGKADSVTIVSAVIADAPATAQPAYEPAGFLLEPWPLASDTARAQPLEPSPAPASEPAWAPDPAPAIEPAPAKESAPPSPAAAAKASHFPMSRPAPSDPLAPILALSDEEKIALFS